MIRYLQRQELDDKKWNDCIDRAPNGLLYAYSFYLDYMSMQWDALVLNDYEAVMPLTWNRKYGIYYLYQPFLAAQLGVFGENSSGEILSLFIRSVPKKFRYIDIYLNAGNPPIPGFPFYTRSNYVLDLSKEYDALFQAFNENTHRNIKKAGKAGYISIKDIQIDNLIAASGLGVNEAKRFRNVYGFLAAKKKALSYGLLSPTNELMAFCVFFFSHNRAYYILAVNAEEAKNTGASHALVNEFIREHAGLNLLLDFEGSDIEGIARFYSAFGAKEEKYPALRWNRLPFLLRWMKK